MPCLISAQRIGFPGSIADDKRKREKPRRPTGAAIAAIPIAREKHFIAALHRRFEPRPE
jgi:hypothetical protein